jgi:RNA polymerase sigma factor (sigma-70 family)
LYGACGASRRRSAENPLAIARWFVQTLLPGNPAVSTPNTSESSPVTDQTRWFAEEVQPHDSLLKAYLRTAYPSVRDVEDVVQESYIRIWKARASHPIESAKAFLFQVARHLALDVSRRNRASPIKGVTDLAALCVLDGRPSADEITCSREEVELLAQAIHTLPARCREIVVLRKLKCVPQKEIAQRLGISEQTVQVQVLRGVRRIAEFLRHRGVYRTFGHEMEK